MPSMSFYEDFGWVAAALAGQMMLPRFRFDQETFKQTKAWSGVDGFKYSQVLRSFR